MPSVRIACPPQLLEGQVTEVEAAGRPFAVCRAGGEYFVLEGICPHAGGRLGHGALDGYFLACPFHAWEFDIRTGKHDYDDRVAVSTFPVRIEGGDLVVDLPD